MGWLRRAMARTVRDALSAHAGDVLCFLPGAGEIRRVQALLEDTPNVNVLPLYGAAHPSPSPPFRSSARERFSLPRSPLASSPSSRNGLLVDAA